MRRGFSVLALTVALAGCRVGTDLPGSEPIDHGLQFLLVLRIGDGPQQANAEGLDVLPDQRSDSIFCFRLVQLEKDRTLPVHPFTHLVDQMPGNQGRRLLVARDM